MTAFRTLAFALCFCIAAPGAAGAQTTNAPAAAFGVNANVALTSLMSLSDGHMLDVQNWLHVIAESDVAQTGKWPAIERLLAQAASANVRAVWGYARTDGSFYTLGGGQQRVKLNDRAFFKRAMQGETTIGDLLISKSTGEPVATVAVPIFGDGKQIVGLLGASVYLKDLSETIRREMGLGPNDLFFSIDSSGVVGINGNPSLILLEPRSVNDELNRSFTRILGQTEGSETYAFQGKKRTVVFRKSDITGWWYAFGKLLP